MAKRDRIFHSAFPDMPKLIIHNPDGTQVKYGLNGRSFAIGRAENNDIILPGGSSSGHHAVLKLTDSGDFEVTDLDSTNHTKVNGKVISKAMLRNGDQLVFGDTMASYESEVVPAPASDNQPTSVYEPAPPQPSRPHASAPLSRQGLPAQSPSAPPPQMRQPYPMAGRPAPSSQMTATDGCFAFFLALFLAVLAFVGGLWARHATDHDGQGLLEYYKEWSSDRSKAQALKDLDGK
jgi:hypothetical protein